MPPDHPRCLINYRLPGWEMAQSVTWPWRVPPASPTRQYGQSLQHHATVAGTLGHLQSHDTLPRTLGHLRERDKAFGLLPNQQPHPRGRSRKKPLLRDLKADSFPAPGSSVGQGAQMSPENMTPGYLCHTAHRRCCSPCPALGHGPRCRCPFPGGGAGVVAGLLRSPPL